MDSLYYFTILSVCFIIGSEGTAKGSIPSHLLDCYTQPPPSLLPLTANTLVEIVRKIQFNSFTPVSMAQEAADLLHWFSIDGLERDPNAVPKGQEVVPYHQTGFQALRQDLLFKRLIPIKRRSFAAYSLSVSEKCTLHAMMSAMVDPWERGNEIKTCPNSFEKFRSSKSNQDRARFSSCPVEGGVVQVGMKAVSVSRVLAGLTAALTPQQVALQNVMPADQLWTGTVDNIWAATLAGQLNQCAHPRGESSEGCIPHPSTVTNFQGDLAEVAVLQAPQYNMDVSIGVAEMWNDTFIPTQLYFNSVPYYLIEKRSWQITNAEILGGIDGLLLGRNAMRMKNQMPELRLSQFLDMYFLATRSGEGFLPCSRLTAFSNGIRDIKEILIEQTKNFALLLTTVATTYFTDSAIITERCVKIVEKFLRYFHEEFHVEKCPPQDSVVPRLNLIMVIDATWPFYTLLQFFVSLTNRADVNYYGSSVTAIKGDSTDVIVNSTSSPVSLYQQLLFYGQHGEDVTGLILQKSLLSVRNIIERDNKNEKVLKYPRRAKQDIVVILGHSSTINDKDFEISEDILSILKKENPASRFIYLTSYTNAQRFRRLVAVPRSHLDTIITTENSQIEVVLPKLLNSLHSERILKPAYCQNNYHHWPESMYEEYITPGETISYWIHPDYLCGSLEIVKITFKNYDHGELHVCMSRDKKEQGDCKHVEASEDVTHALLRPCQKVGAPVWQWDQGCRPVYFTVSVTRSYSKCTGYECRYPDQVRFSIVVQDLHCINLNYAVCSGVGHVISPSYMFGVSILIFIMVFSNR
ncbi:uncharacterized protein LOC124362695 isoform X1 [Homalodisca vitripennis]|uniref:uncharacterized protein LOC124362695 isoform X1 n=2 Tax=Homalodisca vitripennis TaxID=197043 RepID=UPI001EEA0191|nr:uncharacterized protein LOC124362695 isoform X1 [Homalodisca vitripennis]